jgi:stage V sporulation protein G
MPSLDITEIKIYPFDTSSAGGKTLAMAQITINGALILKGFKVIEAKGGGLFVGFPSVKGKDGKWRETVATIDNETKTMIRDRIIEEYKNYSA